MKIKMKKRSGRYDISRPRSRHGYKSSKYKKYLSMMMLIRIKQHLSSIWSWVEKVKVKKTKELSNTEAESNKSV